jgi:hypothetical protein
MTVTQTFDGRSVDSAGTRSQRIDLVLRQDKDLGLEVVDLAKDPIAAGPLARPTTRNSNPDKALVSSFGLLFTANTVQKIAEQRELPGVCQ